MKLTKALKTELLLGCARCGKRFIDARSIKENWRKVVYLNTPNTVTVDDKAIFVCNECLRKT